MIMPRERTSYTDAMEKYNAEVRKVMHRVHLAEQAIVDAQTDDERAKAKKHLARVKEELDWI